MLKITILIVLQASSKLPPSISSAFAYGFLGLGLFTVILVFVLNSATTGTLEPIGNTGEFRVREADIPFAAFLFTFVVGMGLAVIAAAHCYARLSLVPKDYRKISPIWAALSILLPFVHVAFAFATLSSISQSVQLWAAAKNCRSERLSSHAESSAATSAAIFLAAAYLGTIVSKFVWMLYSFPDHEGSFQFIYLMLGFIQLSLIICWFLWMREVDSDVREVAQHI